MNFNSCLVSLFVFFLSDSFRIIAAASDQPNIIIIVADDLVSTQFKYITIFCTESSEIIPQM